jgi:FMN hydrolase / 5-amino-6-(5-phospho-D-ribitylamino)uracil phosphatase
VIEAVLFDGDQTLWDFERVMRLALAAVLTELRAARPGTRADGLQIDDLQADRNEVARETEGVEFNLARLRRLGFARTLSRLHVRDEGGEGCESGDGSGSGINDDALAVLLTATYFDHRDRDPALFDDTLPCLEALRSDYRLGLLSNGSRLPEVVGLSGFFEAVVFAQDHNVAKPDRGIFAVVETMMGVAPGSLVLVGDHPLNDVVGAKRSGWRAVWIDRRGDGSYLPPPGTDERPDAIITSLDQLAGALAAL